MSTEPLLAFYVPKTRAVHQHHVDADPHPEPTFRCDADINPDLDQDHIPSFTNFTNSEFLFVLLLPVRAFCSRTCCRMFKNVAAGHVAACSRMLHSLIRTCSSRYKIFSSLFKLGTTHPGSAHSHGRQKTCNCTNLYTNFKCCRQKRLHFLNNIATTLKIL